MLARQIQERRQRRPRLRDLRRGELRNFEDANFRVLLASGRRARAPSCWCRDRCPPPSGGSLLSHGVYSSFQRAVPASDELQLERADLGDARAQVHRQTPPRSGRGSSASVPAASSRPAAALRARRGPRRRCRRVLAARSTRRSGTRPARRPPRPAPARHFDLGALFHAERRDAHRAHRRLEARHRRHRRLDADVIGARGAAADAHAFAATDHAVVGGAVRDREIESGPRQAPSSFLPVQRFDERR